MCILQRPRKIPSYKGILVSIKFLVVSYVTNNKPPPGPSLNNFGINPRYNPIKPTFLPIFTTVGIVHGILLVLF